MRDLALLIKFRLSITVVISAAAGYLLAVDSVAWMDFTYLMLGGILIVGASNAFNQIWEIERDAKMERTKNRPLPSGRMAKDRAFTWAILFAVLGSYALYSLNVETMAWGLLSMILYVFAYTPMKAKTPWAVFVGAFPGAIPFMLGWVAATGQFGIEPGILFAIQFFWQFPHFWAIGWLSYDDYALAGYNLLPSRRKDSSATYLSLTYSVMMVFLSLWPAFGQSGALQLSTTAAIIVGLLGLDVLRLAIAHHRKQSDSTARALMFGTIRYLPLLQIVYVIDHFLS